MVQGLGMRLTDEQQWAEHWRGLERPRVAMNPLRPLFRDRHRLFQRFIPPAAGGTVLEIGAYPGTYLKYFHDHFGYVPWGVEYVESCAVRAREILAEAGVVATILARDFFSLDVADSPSGAGWDLVASFGFVEHFEDVAPVVERHFGVTRPGGYVVISVPNHAGLSGPVLRAVDPEKWAQHNHMDLSALRSAVEGVPDAEILFSGHVGRFGLWAAGLYSAVRRRHPVLYPLVRAPLWAAEHLSQWLVPNNAWSSPDLLVIARRRPRTA
jgi:SAM-dependent methyltransferase